MPHLVADDVLARMQVKGERRQRSLLIPLLDSIDETYVLFEDLEHVAWIAARLHLHQANEPA